MITIANVATADGYTAPASMEQHQTVRIDVSVLNASAIMQVADEQGNFGAYPEEFLPVGGYSFNRACGGARFKSSATNLPARISCTLLQKADVP